MFQTRACEEINTVSHGGVSFTGWETLASGKILVAAKLIDKGKNTNAIHNRWKYISRKFGLKLPMNRGRAALSSRPPQPLTWHMLT